MFSSVFLLTSLALFVQGSVAQDPRLHSTELDEDELIDALASIAMSGGDDAFGGFGRAGLSGLTSNSNNGYPTGDALSWGDLREAEDDLRAWVAAPRKFAYKPDDPRFYLPPPSLPPATFDNFPKSKFPASSMGRDVEQNELEDLELAENDAIPLFSSNPRGGAPPPANQFYMKKSMSQPEMVEDGGGFIDRRSFSDLPAAPAFEPLPMRPELGMNVGGPAGRLGAPIPASASLPQPGRINLDLFNKNKKEQSPPQPSYSQGSDQNPNYIMKSPHGAEAPGVLTSRLDQPEGGIFSSIYYIAIIAGCSAAAVVGVVAAGICWYRIHERVKAAADVDYPAYGVTGPSKDKQQMAALQKSPTGDRQGSGGSDVESEDDNEDGDYTVYECPGLAGLCNSGEMEVKNPLYDDEPTPATPQVIQSSADDLPPTTTITTSTPAGDNQ